MNIASMIKAKKDQDKKWLHWFQRRGEICLLGNTLYDYKLLIGMMEGVARGAPNIINGAGETITII